MMLRAVWRRLVEQRGAALLTVLLLTVLLFILVSAMLLAAGKEIFMAGLHRDGIRAEELVQSALEDILRRMQSGRPWKPGAVAEVDRCVQDGSPGIRMSLRVPQACVTVITRVAGPSGAFLEVRAGADAGRARRKVSVALLTRNGTLVPGVLVLRSHREDPGIEIGSGVVAVQTFVRYRAAVSADRMTYAGWRIEHTPEASGTGSGPCYTHAECVTVGRPQWWPGHRRAVYAGLPLRRDPLPGNVTPDPRRPDDVLGYACPPGPPPAQAGQAIGIEGPGFQSGDLRADLDPADPLQSAVAAEPLYGCTGDGLAYTWLRDALDGDEDGTPDTFLWFKVVRFDQWLTRYMCFDEGALSWVPCNGFHFDPGQGDPGLGVVLPMIPIPAWAQNYDERRTGGGWFTPADLDLGRCTDPPLCADMTNNRTVIALRRGTYTLLCPVTCPEGHGTVIADDDLTFGGSFTYLGTIAVGGVLASSSGATTVIHGALSATLVRAAGGTLRLFPGTPVVAGAAGPVAIDRRAWWER